MPKGLRDARDNTVGHNATGFQEPKKCNWRFQLGAVFLRLEWIEVQQTLNNTSSLFFIFREGYHA